MTTPLTNLRNSRRHARTAARWGAVAAIASLGVAAMACSTAAPGASTATPTLAANTAAPPAGNQTQVPGTIPAPVSGQTTFHMVIAEGPKAGTYDISTSAPGACSVADEGYFVASYLETDKPGLDYISATLHPGPITGLVFAFDAETDSKVNFVGVGTVTVDLDDRGSTATMRVVSDMNHGTQEAEPTTVQAGRVELTVECASVLRPGG
jgi:hypothetical protein